MSAIRIPLDRRVPVPLIRKLVKAAMKSNESEGGKTGAGAYARTRSAL